MNTRRFLVRLLLVSFALVCAGCAALDPQPVHLTVYVERDEAESGGAARQRAATTKAGLSASLDLR